MKFAEYKIVRNSAAWLSKFEDDINELMEQGWQPHGELTVVHLDKQEFLIQPMVRPL